MIMINDEIFPGTANATTREPRNIGTSLVFRHPISPPVVGITRNLLAFGGLLVALLAP